MQASIPWKAGNSTDAIVGVTDILIKNINNGNREKAFKETGK